MSVEHIVIRSGDPEGARRVAVDRLEHKDGEGARRVAVDRVEHKDGEGAHGVAVGRVEHDNHQGPAYGHVIGGQS